MSLTAQELYTSILYRAADIYDVDTDDVEGDIGQNFDPVVRFMAGAMASELEQVYHLLDSTERRLQEKIGQVLLSESFHLPEPAHALARAFPKNDAFVIDEATQFRTNIEEGDAQFHFSPIFPARLLNAKISVVATDTEIIRFDKRARIRRGDQSTEEIQKLAIGFAAPSSIENWQGCPLYFDLTEQGSSESERAVFFSAMGNASYVFHGNTLSHFQGTGRNNLSIEDYLNGNQRLEASIRARYDHNFVTFSSDDCPEVSPKTAEEFFDSWFDQLDSNLRDDIDNELKAFTNANEEPMFWLEVHFKQPIPLSNFKRRIQIDFNIFPVVNRRLCGQGSDEHYWLQTNAIRWIPLDFEDQFYSIREVYEENPPENKRYIFKPFSGFKEDKDPTYTIRYGGIGRWDDYNTWKRLVYLVNILRENHKNEELIEAAASALSIEEVHQLLGRKIDKTASQKDPQKSVYILLQSGTESGVRVRVEHWTSKGESANGVSAKTGLICVSKHRTSLDKNELALVSNVTGGRDALNSTERIDAMKGALLSRGRLVTREDVKVYCKNFLRDQLDKVEINDGVGSMPGFSTGMTRILDVILYPSKAGSKADWEGICRQLQVMITKLSSAHIPVRVKLAQKVIPNE